MGKPAPAIVLDHKAGSNITYSSDAFLRANRAKSEGYNVGFEPQEGTLQ
jgi:hypothetical protein